MHKIEVFVLDVSLQRILSLLPTKPDGKIVRGAKKDFAINIGYESGDIVSQWIKGESTSYKNKLHEIASKYDVSVEWLKGETDIKKETAAPDSLTQEILDKLALLTPQNREIALAQLDFLISRQEKQDT